MKHQLNDWMPTELGFELFQIFCHIKDYRLCHALNEHFKCDFRRIGDFLEEEDKPHLPTYAHFEYSDPITHKTYYVIANQPTVKEVVRHEGDLFPTEQPELLIPEMPKVDYFLQLYGQFEDYEIEDIGEELNMIPLVIAAQRVDPSSLTSYINLMH